MKTTRPDPELQQEILDLMEPRVLALQPGTPEEWGRQLIEVFFWGVAVSAGTFGFECDKDATDLMSATTNHILEEGWDHPNGPPPEKLELLEAVSYWGKRFQYENEDQIRAEVLEDLKKSGLVGGDVEG